METYCTSRCVILLVEGEDRRYLYHTGANAALTVDQIDRKWLSGLQVFYLGGLFVLPGLDLERLVDLLRFCRRQGVKTVVDVVVPQEVSGMASIGKLLPLVDVFVPNHDEAQAFTGMIDPFDQLAAFDSAGAHTVIVTRGKAGAVASTEGQHWHCGSYAMNVVDPSGSGDAFTSGVIRSLLQGWDMPQTLRYASAVGASVTRAVGTTDAVFSAEEARVFIDSHPLSVTEECRPLRAAKHGEGAQSI